MPFDEEYFKSEDFQELLNSYEASIASGDTLFLDADDLADIADYYNYVGQEDKADDVVDRGLELYPHETLLNVFKARQALMQEDYDKARSYCDAIDDKDTPDYHYLVAEIMIAEGNMDQADEFLRKLYVETAPDEVQDFVKDVANLYIDYGINDKAYEWMMRSKGDNSDDFKELMARTLFGLGKYKDSQKLFNELIDHNPYSIRYWNALASAQFMDEDYGAAITSSEYAIAIDPEDPEGLLAKANGLLKIGNFEESIDYYRRYLKCVGDDPVAHLHIGACLVNLGHESEAIVELKKALKNSDPDDDNLKIQVYQELAFCYASLKKTDQAMAMLDKATKLPCDQNDLLVVRGHILLGAERIEEAEEAFRQALYRSNSDPAVTLRIIVSLYDNHYIKASYSMFKKFFQMTHGKQADNGYAYMALCCHDLGYADEFLYYLEEAVKRNPRETRLVLCHLFPEGMDVSQYVPYVELRIKNVE